MSHFTSDHQSCCVSSSPSCTSPPPAIISNELRCEKASDTNTNPVWEVSAVMQAWFPIKTSAWRVIKCDKEVFFLFFFFHRGDQGFARSSFHSPPTYQHRVLYCLLPVAPPPPPLPLSCSLPLDLTLRSGSSGLVLPFVSFLFLPTEPSPKSLPSSLILLLLPHHHKVPSVDHRLRGDLSP